MTRRWPERERCTLLIIWRRAEIEICTYIDDRWVKIVKLTDVHILMSGRQTARESEMDV